MRLLETLHIRLKVVGSNDKKSNRILKNLSNAISKGAQYLNTSRRAAELIKYASMLLATKITFIMDVV